jgi:hypothetical protein
VRRKARPTATSQGGTHGNGDDESGTEGIAVAKEARDAGVEAKDFSVRSDGGQLAEIAKLVDAGSVKSRVETVLPPGQAAHAHELVQSGRARGKVVLKVRDWPIHRSLCTWPWAFAGRVVNSGPPHGPPRTHLKATRSARSCAS